MLLRSLEWFSSRSSGCSSQFAARSSASPLANHDHAGRYGIAAGIGIGVGVGYVLGGVIGRLLTGGMGKATR